MNVAALQDRGHVMVFEPSAAEVHHKAGTWFDDREIYEWFGANLHRVHEPSMRQYVRAGIQTPRNSENSDTHKLVGRSNRPGHPRSKT